MIVHENLTSYIHSLEPESPLESLRQEAENQEVPVIRREMEPFIRLLLKTAGIRRILEIGTGVGYSAMFMASCLDDVRITTIENYEPRLKEARKNLEKMECIHLIEGDAAQVIQELQDTYDLIFLDGPKGQYITMLPDLLRLLKSGGLLLADNVLQDGGLTASLYLTSRRQRTIHTRMRSFLWEVKHHPDLDSAVLTIGDGVVLSRKK